MAKEGRETKVHFTFVLDKFASARPFKLLIIYSIPSTSGSYNSSFWLFVRQLKKPEGWYQMSSLKNSKIPKLDLQTYQGMCSLD